MASDAVASAGLMVRLAGSTVLWSGAVDRLLTAMHPVALTVLLAVDVRLMVRGLWRLCLCCVEGRGNQERPSFQAVSHQLLLLALTMPRLPGA